MNVLHWYLNPNTYIFFLCDFVPQLVKYRGFGPEPVTRSITTVQLDIWLAALIQAHRTNSFLRIIIRYKTFSHESHTFVYIRRNLCRLPDMFRYLEYMLFYSLWSTLSWTESSVAQVLACQPSSQPRTLNLATSNDLSCVQWYEQDSLKF